MEKDQTLVQAVPLVDLKAQYLSIKEELGETWAEILEGMHLFLGPHSEAFEEEFARYCGTSYASGVSDGTTALELALRACEIGPGDEVITVSHTFIATVEAIWLVGAKPVFVDIDPRTMLLDVSQIESRITPQTRAILPVHLYGQCVDMDPILDIAMRHGLVVIEDACQAHGATYKGRKAGSMGTMAAFSFYFSKNLGAYGEGGMITTSDTSLHNRVRKLRNHGSQKRYVHDSLGKNGRLDELQAAALRIKLRCLDQWNEARRAAAARYNLEFALIGVDMPLELPANRHVYHLYVIQTTGRDGLQQHLAEQKIGTGIHYPIPVHLQEVYSALGGSPISLPVTEGVSSRILSLPMFPEITEDQINRVVLETRRYLKNLKKDPPIKEGELAKRKRVMV